MFALPKEAWTFPGFRQFIIGIKFRCQQTNMWDQLISHMEFKQLPLQWGITKETVLDKLHKCRKCTSEPWKTNHDQVFYKSEMCMAKPVAYLGFCTGEGHGGTEQKNMEKKN